MSAVERVARALKDAGCNEDHDVRLGFANAALAAICQMDAETERAVALASCSRTDRISGRCQCSFLKMEDDCLNRGRRTVDALVKAMEGCPERPMLNRIGEYIGAVRYQNVPSLRIAHGVLDLIANPSSAVVEAVEIECRMTPPGEFLKGLRAYIQRIREAG